MLHVGPVPAPPPVDRPCRPDGVPMASTSRPGAQMLHSCSLVPYRCSASPCTVPYLPAPACTPLVVALIPHASEDHPSAFGVAWRSVR